jgi:hypothetical protein
MKRYLGLADGDRPYLPGAGEAALFGLAPDQRNHAWVQVR